MDSQELERSIQYLKVNDGFNSSIHPSEVSSYIRDERDFILLMDYYLKGNAQDGYEKLYNLIGYLPSCDMPIRLIKEVLLLSEGIKSNTLWNDHLRRLIQGDGLEEFSCVLVRGISICKDIPLHEVTHILSNPIWDSSWNLCTQKIDCICQMDESLGEELTKDLLQSYINSSDNQISNYAKESLRDLEY